MYKVMCKRGRYKPDPDEISNLFIMFWGPCLVCRTIVCIYNLIYNCIIQRFEGGKGEKGSCMYIHSA